MEEDSTVGMYTRILLPSAFSRNCYAAGLGMAMVCMSGWWRPGKQGRCPVMSVITDTLCSSPQGAADPASPLLVCISMR